MWVDVNSNEVAGSLLWLFLEEFTAGGDDKEQCCDDFITVH